MVFKQLLKAMKLTAIFLLLACLTAGAKGFSQITLSEKNAPLQKIFKAIQKQSGYDFFYTYEVIEKAGNATVNLNRMALEKAIEEVLKGKPLTYIITGKTVVIKEKINPSFIPGIPEQAEAASRISGLVKDEKGMPGIVMDEVVGHRKAHAQEGIRNNSNYHEQRNRGHPVTGDRRFNPIRSCTLKKAIRGN